jgi:predicted ATPase/DNA-binding CsgD family transcriptional regulator
MRQKVASRRPTQRAGGGQRSARNRALQTLGAPRGTERRPTDPVRRGRARVNRPQHHLPAQRTRLIGRVQDIAELSRRLLHPDVRLMTLVGPPGVGKTRLALAVAEAVLADFQHGVVFVPLAPLGDPELVVSAIAHQVGAPEQSGRSLLASLTAVLERQHRLLVLDNFEHVLDAATVVTDLLAACPDLKVLATSRTHLHLYGEHEFPVPPLGLPDDVDVPNVARLGEAPAVALFVERAGAARPSFALTEENAAAVAEICARLDGLPLAIELAAARVRLLAPGAILERLDQRLDLLGEGPRDWPARHRTARALVDWSYDLLSEEQRVLLRRLSVFAGGWTVEAAEAVCGFGVLDSTAVMDLLARLVDQSLVLAEEQGGAGRFRLLETIREFGLEQLEVHGGGAPTRRRHAQHYLAFVEEADLRLRGPEGQTWLDRLEAEHDNLRAALAWCKTDPSSVENGVRLAGALWRFWYVSGYAKEGLGLLEGALSASGAVPTSVRAQGLTAAGMLMWSQSDYARAGLLLEEALTLSRELGDRFTVALALSGLGYVARSQGDCARAGVLQEEALALSRELGDRPGIARALFSLGYVALFQGDYARAAALQEEALALCREIGDRWGIARALSGLGYVALFQGDYARAAALYTESLALYEQTGSKPDIAPCLEGLARVAGAQGEPARAARLCGAAEVLREAIGAPVQPPARAAHERTLSAIRAGLGEDGFSVARAEGRVMSLDQAVAYALKPASPPSRPAASRVNDPWEPLTSREREVAALVARGLTNRQVAQVLVIAERTADTHVANILRKLELATRTQLAAWTIQQGLIPREPG